MSQASVSCSKFHVTQVIWLRLQSARLGEHWPNPIKRYEWIPISKPKIYSAIKWCNKLLVIMQHPTFPPWIWPLAVGTCSFQPQEEKKCSDQRMAVLGHSTYSTPASREAHFVLWDGEQTLQSAMHVRTSTWLTWPSWWRNLLWFLRFETYVTPIEVPKACVFDPPLVTPGPFCIPVRVLWTLLNSPLQPLFEACWYSCALPVAVLAKRPMKCWTRRQALLNRWIDIMAVVKWFWDTESYITSSPGRGGMKT